MIAITDDNDSVKATYTYLPYGELSKKTGTILQPFTFLGEFGVEQETDSCYYIRARYYDASTRRFLTKDPLFGDGFEPQSLNRYLYSLNNPILYFDISGFTTADNENVSFWSLLKKGFKESYYKAIESLTNKENWETAFTLATFMDGGELLELKSLTNEELIKIAATEAERVVGGVGPVAGTAKHEYATKFLKEYQDLYGYRGIETKVYFNNNAKFGAGNRGFLDVLDNISNTIYDFKFGDATMGNAQYMKYSRNFDKYPIKTIKP